MTTLAMTPDGKRILTASRSLQVRVWDAATGESLRSFRAHDAPVISMAVDSTGFLLATGSSDGTTRVWDIEKGFATHNFGGQRSLVTSLIFHPHPQRYLVFLPVIALAYLHPDIFSLPALTMAPCASLT